MEPAVGAAASGNLRFGRRRPGFRRCRHEVVYEDETSQSRSVLPQTTLPEVDAAPKLQLRWPQNHFTTLRSTSKQPRATHKIGGLENRCDLELFVILV